MGTAIVTGASRGLGWELAKLLDARGHRIVLVARSTEALEDLTAELPNPLLLSADLATLEGISTVTDAVEQCDLLVNNAGAFAAGDFAGLSVDRALEIVNVNCLAVTALTAHYLPGMLERRQGHVLNIASVAGFLAGPNWAVYYASKAFILNFTEAIAEETRNSGVKVTAFCPGAFRGGNRGSKPLGPSKRYKGRRVPSAAEMAVAAMQAMDRGKPVSVPGLGNKLSVLSTRLLPRSLLRRLVRYI